MFKNNILFLTKADLYASIIFVFVMVYLLLFGSCKTCPPIAVQSDTVTIAIVKHHYDTTLVTQKDSSWFYELLECVNGKVIEVEKSDVNNGKSTILTHTLDNNVLAIKCVCDTHKIRFGYVSQDSIKTEKIIQTKTVTVNVLTGWQYAQMRIGDILGLLVLGFIAFKLIKK